MSKTKNKQKNSKSSAPSKPAKKAAGKPSVKSKALKPLEKITKAVAKVLGKKEASVKEAKPVSTGTKKEAAAPASPAPQQAKKAKAPKADKSKKKKTEEFDDDLLAGDEDLGSEEIPDLSEFDETEEEVIEDSSDDSDVLVGESKPASDEEVVLLDAEGRRYCRVRDCDQAAIVEGYCRFHYLLLWKKIQIRRKILVDGKLQRYVEELTARYPDKFLEMLRKDLKTEKDFLAAIAELEIDESAIDNDFEDEAQSYIDEVRGMSETNTIPDEEEF